MVCVSGYTSEHFSPMKFGRSKFRNTDFTEEATSIHPNLERIAVDKFHGRICRNENIPLIDVTDNMTVSVDVSDGACEISCGVNKKCPIRLWKRDLAICWTVERVNRLIARQLWH